MAAKYMIMNKRKAKYGTEIMVVCDVCEVYGHPKGGVHPVPGMQGVPVESAEAYLEAQEELDRISLSI